MTRSLSSKTLLLILAAPLFGSCRAPVQKHVRLVHAQTSGVIEADEAYFVTIEPTGIEAQDILEQAVDALMGRADLQRTTIEAEATAHLTVSLSQGEGRDEPGPRRFAMTLDATRVSYESSGRQRNDALWSTQVTVGNTFTDLSSVLPAAYVLSDFVERSVSYSATAKVSLSEDAEYLAFCSEIHESDALTQ